MSQSGSGAGLQSMSGVGSQSAGGAITRLDSFSQALMGDLGGRISAASR